ncbi:MAG: BglG family transcription antiterminator [Romboutsia sp.]|uniref:BglG family transcription antiterminator n=1 Tax=Romboutsia sp. TaxID=1965302 RepID=UPI003F300063
MNYEEGDLMITKKHAIIVKYLNDKDGYTTSNELATLLEVSTKTIKRYISDINDYIKKYNVEISSSRGIGYKLNGTKSNLANLLDEAKQYINGFVEDDSDESRITNTICMFINKQYISIEDIADNLNLSIGATNKLATKIKETIKRYNLTIKSKPYYGSFIFGEEISLRQLITDYAIKTDENNKIKVHLDNITQSDISNIENTLGKYLRKQEIIISDKDFNLLVSKIIVSIFRNNVGCSDGIRLLDTGYRLHNYVFIKKIMEEISQKIGFELVEDEILYISNYSGVVANSCKEMTNASNKSEEKINKLIGEALKDILLISGRDYSKDEDFMKSIFEHIKRFINRSKANVTSSNPLLDQIKSKFTIEFNLAIFLAKKIESEFNVVLNEDELGYIAIHFAAANERNKKNTSKNICIVCHYGIGTGQLLSEKLKQSISDLNVVGVYPARYLDMAIDQEIDLIVSTVEIKDSEKPVLYINNIFDDNIVENVNKAFYEKEERRKIINNMFDKEAFFTIKGNEKNEVILTICNKLKEKGFIEDDSIESILNREKISSTEIGNLVAIPHTIVEGDKKSIIGVAVLENPIIWDKQEVQLVFMVFFNPKEKHNFSIFKYLYNFIKDEGGVRGIIKICEFDKFMTLIED